MDAQQFLAEFGHIANAPGGVARLREMIFSLAVSGDLVTPDPVVSALPLIASIERQKALHSEQKKVISKQAPVGSLSKTFPRHWVACRLGDLALTITGGGTPSKNNPAHWTGNIPWASVKDLKDQKYLSQTMDHITADGLAGSSSNLIPAGRIIVCTRMGLGKIVINTVPLAINQDLKALELPEEVDRDFFFILYKTLKLKGTGTTVSGIKQDQLLALPVTLPPTEEQSRIVAKVDELMALCDQLEVKQQQRRSLQDKLRQSTLQAVAAATSPHERQTTWARLADNFGQLVDAPEDVQAFKALILDLAVSGQLLKPEEFCESHGSALLNLIAAARLAWSKASYGQEQKEASTMIKKLRTQQVAELDSVLPAHWTWATLLQVSQAVVDCHNKTAPYVNDGIHLIRTTDIRNGRMLLTNTRKISEETYLYWARRMPPVAGDIFFTREAPMGEAAIVPKGEKVCLGQRSMLIRLFPDLFSNQFLLYVIQSPSFQARMKDAAIGMTVRHLKVGGVEDLLVPVPPIAEQDRIVAIVDHLFSICDRMIDQLARKQKTATNFATCSIAVITGIDITSEEDIPLKAPQIELIAPLRLGQTPNRDDHAPLATLLTQNKGELFAGDLCTRFGQEIDVFYAQLKQEVANGWIQQPEVAEMREKAVA